MGIVSPLTRRMRRTLKALVVLIALAFATAIIWPAVKPPWDWRPDPGGIVYTKMRFLSRRIGSFRETHGVYPATLDEPELDAHRLLRSLDRTRYSITYAPPTVQIDDVVEQHRLLGWPLSRTVRLKARMGPGDRMEYTESTIQ
jgi:hypothetical protein